MSTTAPINGEILVGPPSAACDASSRRSMAAEDAEFVTLGNRQTSDVVQTAGPAAVSAAPGDTGTPDGLGLLRPQAGTIGLWRPMAVRAASGLAVALAIGLTLWVAGGHMLSTKPVQLSGDIAQSAVRLERAESRFAARADGPGVILINGTIANDSANAQGVPPVTVRITSAAGHSRRYVFGTQNRILNGGQSMDFAYRVDAPAGGARNVEILLAEER